ncbi:hypothetical protein [Gemmatirosa kalamazoonensis]|uniref:hypothetical protein n=1 Tax=Gemmatirosa kalamazoonensis TaxID=861299 RepID=UPI0011DC8C7E|nr:hypothetical protein [Gemmatirosa kalamazoonensis]
MVVLVRDAPEGGPEVVAVHEVVVGPGPEASATGAPELVGVPSPAEPSDAALHRRVLRALERHAEIAAFL